jgi:transposase
MNGRIAQTIGVDISKDALDVHLHPAGVARQFTNNAKGFTALIARLEVSEVSRVVFEPTGAYHHAFERRLGQAGLSLGFDRILVLPFPM